MLLLLLPFLINQFDSVPLFALYVYCQLQYPPLPPHLHHLTFIIHIYIFFMYFFNCNNVMQMSLLFSNGFDFVYGLFQQERTYSFFLSISVFTSSSVLFFIISLIIIIIFYVFLSFFLVRSLSLSLFGTYIKLSFEIKKSFFFVCLSVFSLFSFTRILI